MSQVYWTDMEIADLIDEWHNAEPSSTAARVPLHEYLGFTWDEYVARFGPVAVRQAAAEDRAGEGRDDV